MINKSDARRSNQLTEIKDLLNRIGREKDTAAFAAIDKISIEKEWNEIGIENFETYTNDCNFEDSLIALLIPRNLPFAVRIFSKQLILIMNYVKKKNNDAVAMIENTNFNMSAIAFVLSISQTFNIFSSSAFFFFYMNYTKLYSE